MNNVSDILKYTGNPLVLLVLGMLVPPVVSFLKSWNAKPAVAATIQWVITVLAVAASFLLDEQFTDIPVDRSKTLTYMVTKFLIVLAISSIWFRNAWRPSGADEAVSRNVGLKLGEKDPNTPR